LFFEIDFFAEFCPKNIMYNWNGFVIIVLWCCVQFGTWFEGLEVLISIHMRISWFESVCLSPCFNSSSSPKQSKKIKRHWLHHQVWNASFFLALMWSKIGNGLVNKHFMFRVYFWHDEVFSF
jgi:hypothetical protein